MQNPLVELVLLGLLVTFFGIQQRTRPQLYFRLWFTGWILICVSFITWELRIPFPPHLAAFTFIEEVSLYLGGLAFMLSYVVQPGRGLQAAITALTTAVPAAILFRLSTLPHPSFTLIFVCVLLLEAAFIRLTYSLLPRDWTYRRIALGLLAVGSAVLIVLSARSSQIENLNDWITAQVFIAAAFLFSTSTTRRGVGWFIGSLGFFAWGLLYPISSLLQHNADIFRILNELWNLPKYTVGFAMTLIIFEEARADVVSLADRYKDLYGDFRLLYDHHPLAMWIYDPVSLEFLSANAAAADSYGYSQQEFLGMQVEQLNQPTPPLKPSAARLALMAPQEQPALANGARRAHHQRKDGSRISVELTEHAILFQGREARFVLSVDITEREKLNQELSHRAQHDALTGLPNRLLLDERISQCVQRCIREDKKAVLFTMDADRFKLINDTYGHLVGDDTLKAIADRLRGRIRSVDTIARTGGEEFTAIIGGINSQEDAERIAAMFLRLFDKPLTLPDHELKVSISIGAAIYPDDAIDSDTLRKKSDQALYHAKRMGRNRFAFASREVCASFDQAMAIEMALREALRSDGFTLAFQPIYASDGSALHFEALLRMRPENAVVFPPGTFIPIAEECGLIIPIGNWVVEEACRQLVEWRKLAGDHVTVAVNVSGKQLLQKGFNFFVLECLDKAGLPPSALELELTETSLMTEPVIVRESMAELAAVGVRFSIDDFGTGYSSLGRLAHLPISLLKIDRSFIAELDHAGRNDGIVAAIIHMAQTLNVRVVAEGVETELQLNQLVRRGCDLFQGYYLSRPLPPAEISAMLADESSQLYSHPNFNLTRAALNKRLRQANQFVPLAEAGVEGAA